MYIPRNPRFQKVIMMLLANMPPFEILCSTFDSQVRGSPRPKEEGEQTQAQVDRQVIRGRVTWTLKTIQYALTIPSWLC